MTEQEYKVKTNQVKQIRTQIADLQTQETHLKRELVAHQFKDVKNKYFYHEASGSYIKPIECVGEKIFCVVSESEFCPYQEDNNYYFIQKAYWANEFSEFTEISKEMYIRNMSQRMNTVSRIFGLGLR